MSESQTLKEAISAYQSGFREKAPQNVQETMAEATRDLIASGIEDRAPALGDTLPDFTLPNHQGKPVSLSGLTEDGPVVITFYRGGWCPYCNLELRAFQSILPELNALGAKLLAITPESPDNSLNTMQKNELAFEVLTDEHSDYARQLGLVFSLPESLRPIYAQFGIDIEKHNGKGDFDLPVPATFVVGKGGEILSRFVNADYTKRQEPREVLAVLNNK